MKKGLTEMVFLLDRSGSMRGLEDDTIGGFNSTIDRQKELPGEGIVTTVLFNQGYKVLHDRFDLRDVAEMTREDYYVGGCTALLDAMGSAIQKEINVQHNLPDNAKAEKVIFVIITDGHENASCEYTYSDVGKMVEAQKEKGWEFLFLGANMDAVQEARRFGIEGSRAATYRCDDIGTRVVYEGVDRAMCSIRSLRKGKLDDSWKDEIEKDMKTRG